MLHIDCVKGAETSDKATGTERVNISQTALSLTFLAFPVSFGHYSGHRLNSPRQLTGKKGMQTQPERLPLN